MQAGNRLVELAGHVDVSLRRGVALVAHELLKRIGRQPRGVLRGECPPQVVEAVDVAMAGVRVFLSAREAPLRCFLAAGALRGKGGPRVCSPENPGWATP